MGAAWEAAEAPRAASWDPGEEVSEGEQHPQAQAGGAVGARTRALRKSRPAWGRGWGERPDGQLSGQGEETRTPGRAPLCWEEGRKWTWAKEDFLRYVLL